MAVELEMPELAESVIEGEIVKWLVQEGEHVTQDQPLVEVMTDKVTVEIPSPYEGVLLKHVAAEGAVVAIGKPIAIFGKEGENVDAGASLEHVTPQPKVTEEKEMPQAAADGQTAASAEPKAPAESAKPQRAGPHGSNGQALPGTVAPGEKAVLSAFGRPMAAPAVRKFARESNVDLFSVAGSGESGRIRREDVERVVAARKSAAGSKAAAPKAAAISGETQRVPLRGLRRAIADRMVQS
ncbi:MAG: E3 binding domain-containing protein, partial [Candidatus Eremiobacteraeota bacterium]|nr:E3 binding domain-containing protein [Candidatus Eremiobacteraeota bacterium]